jgi:hypothetical protein
MDLFDASAALPVFVALMQTLLQASRKKYVKSEQDLIRGGSAIDR